MNEKNCDTLPLLKALKPGLGKVSFLFSRQGSSSSVWFVTSLLLPSSSSLFDFNSSFNLCGIIFLLGVVHSSFSLSIIFFINDFLSHFASSLEGSEFMSPKAISIYSAVLSFEETSLSSHLISLSSFFDSDTQRTQLLKCSKSHITRDPFFVPGCLAVNRADWQSTEQILLMIMIRLGQV